MDSDDQDIFSEFRDPERKRLIKEIREKEPRLLSRIPVDRYAALWLSDIEVLEAYAASNANFLMAMVANPSYIDYVGIIAGTKQNRSKLTPQKRSHDASTAFGDDYADFLSKPGPRDLDVADLVSKRDNEKCLLTGNPRWTCDVCHIIPHKLNSNNGDMIWGWLHTYWSTEKCETWMQQILGKNGKFDTEQVLNMLTFSVQIRSYWINSICAFRPISVNEDKASMTLAFHWCPPRDISHSRFDLVPIEDHLYPEYPNGFINSPIPGVGILDPFTKMNMKSGRIFTIKTADPANQPLPSFELLELLWNLHRIKAMRGAADDPESDEDEDQEDSFSFRSRSPSRSPSPSDIHPVLQDYLDSYNPDRSITPTGSKTPSITSSPEDSDFVKVE